VPPSPTLGWLGGGGGRFPRGPLASSAMAGRTPFALERGRTARCQSVYDCWVELPPLAGVKLLGEKEKVTPQPARRDTRPERRAQRSGA
jgi:hypothetical protein